MSEVAVVGGNEKALLAIFERKLEELVRSCRRPAERRIRYGNLRSEISPSSGNGDVTNAAVVYETPGGSTTQINITFDEGRCIFSYLGEDLAETVTCSDPDEVIEMVRRHAHGIPAKRMRALTGTIDLWLSEGKTRREMFVEMNKLLQNEFLGGRITNDELKAGIRHIVQQYQAQQQS